MNPNEQDIKGKAENDYWQRAGENDEIISADEEPSRAQASYLRAKRTGDTLDKEVVDDDGDDEDADDEDINWEDATEEYAKHGPLAGAPGYVLDLIHNNLVDVLSRELAGEALSEEKHVALEDLDIIEEFGKGLVKADEPMLAIFLRVALMMRQSLDNMSALARTIDYLFRSVKRVTSSASTLEGFGCGIVFLQDTLVALIRKNRPDEQENPASHISTSNTSSHFYVTLGEKVFRLGLQDILPCFWGRKLDTVCHSCGQPFTSTPPIRTFMSRHTGDLSVATTLSIRIRNRHFHCLEAEKVPFIPVSHIWHEPIRSANATGVHNNDAAQILIDTLKVLLKGAKSSYNQDVEFWHDYFSVPQWQEQTKAALLVSIPIIYSSPEEILIHMADLPHSAVAGLFDILLQFKLNWDLLKTYNEVAQALEAQELYDSVALLADLGACKWMQRMWVMLEYYQSKESCIMDQSGFIWRSERLRNSFMTMMKGAYIALTTILPFCPDFTAHLVGRRTIMGIQPSGAARSTNMCLGEALAEVRDRQCQIFRDRLIAIYVILKGRSASENSTSIPTTIADACVWVWTQAIAAGDYSPLLLQHGSHSGEAENVPGVPSWVVGYRDLNSLEWDLISQEVCAERTPTVVNGVVYVPFDVVGIIEEIQFLDFEKAGNVAGVDWAIRALIAAAKFEGINPSCENIVSDMWRIFPLSYSIERRAREQSIALSLLELEDQEPDVRVKLEQLLDVYSNGSTNEALHQEASGGPAKSIAHLLQLERQIEVAHRLYHTRLSHSYEIAQLRRNRGATGGESVCKVRCSSCRIVTFSRLDLGQWASVGDMVYRIPGLCYTSTIEEGVGLVVRNGKITGRMLYDPPACACKVIENVELI